MRNFKFTLLLAVALLASTFTFAQKDTDNGTITVSGGTVTLADTQGSGAVTFEQVITGAPATISITTNGCMRGGNCVVLDTYTTVANRVIQLAGGYDNYQITASWTGGTAPTVVTNKTGIRAKLGGYPQRVAKTDLFAQSAEIGQTTLYAVPVSAGGLYRMSCYLIVTQVATTSSTLPQCTAHWTDADNNLSGLGVLFTSQSTTNTLTTHSALGGGAGVATFNARGGTNIIFNTTGYASVGATPMQFAIHLKLEYLGN